MKKILFFLSTIFVLASSSCAQYVINGRLQIKSGTGLNSVIGGSDTVYFGWNAHQFSFYDKDTNKILEFGLADTAKFYSNLKFSSAYTDGTIYWPNSDNSYIKGNALYFLHGSEFLQAIPTQLKISASTHDYTTLNSYRLALNKAAGEFIQIDTNGVLMYNSDFTVRDQQGFEFLKHTTDSFSIFKSRVSMSYPNSDTALRVAGIAKIDSLYLNDNSYFMTDGTYSDLFVSVPGTSYGIDVYADKTYSEIGIYSGVGKTTHLQPNLLQLSNDVGSINTYISGEYFELSQDDSYTFREANTHQNYLLFDSRDFSIRMYGNLKVDGSVQVGSVSTVASSASIGTIRYRSDANNSYCEMVMQTGASSYDWVVIKQNTW